MVDYGYGDAAPDVAKYGYGDAAPDTDVAKYGYGDAAPDDAAKYGYGDAAPDGEYQAGYNDQDAGGSKMRRFRRGGDGNESDDNMSTGSVDSNGQPKRAHRPRRRNSVTRYSLVANEEAASVAREHEDNAARIEQFRQGLLNGQGLDMVPGSNVPHFSGASIGEAAAASSSSDYTSEADRILQQQLEDTEERPSSRALSTTSSASGDSGDEGKERKKGTKLGRGMRAIGRRFSVGA